MRGYWFFLLLMGRLLGDIIYLNENPVNYNDLLFNEVRRTVNVQVDVSSPDVTIQIYPPDISAQNQAIITDLGLADILISTESKTKTLTEIAKDKKLTLTTTLTMNANPKTTGGYQILMQLQTLRFNYNIEDVHFFNFQSIPLQETVVSVVNPALLYQHLELSSIGSKNWVAFVDGMVVSDNWTSIQWVTEADTFGSTKKTKKKLTISIPADSFLTLEDGTYWFTIEAIMQPYTTPTIAENVNSLSTLAQTQLLFRNELIADINILLQDTTTLDRFTTEEIAVLTANKKLLQKEVKEISTEVNAYFTTLSKKPTATASDQQLITEQKAAITLLAQEEVD